MNNADELQLELSPTAAQAIVEQADYYRDQSGAVLAQRFRIATQNTIDSLFEMTERGTLCHFPRLRLAGLRWIVIPKFPFRVFYLFDKEAGRIRIVHVLHKRRDIETLLDRAMRALQDEQ